MIVFRNTSGEIWIVHYEIGDMLLMTKRPPTVRGTAWSGEIRPEDEIILYVRSISEAAYGGKLVTIISLVSPNTGKVIEVVQDELFKYSDPITL